MMVMTDVVLSGACACVGVDAWCPTYDAPFQPSLFGTCGRINRGYADRNANIHTLHKNELFLFFNSVYSVFILRRERKKCARAARVVRSEKRYSLVAVRRQHQ